jgi:uncharacterized delta-60 repeat protein
VPIPWRLTPRGRIVAAGRTGGDARFALARYKPDGSLDPSFGIGGEVTTKIGASYAGSVAIDSQGRIVVAAYTDRSFRFRLIRFLPDGSLDPSFGGDGTVLSAILGYSGGGPSVTIDNQDRVVVAGASDDELDPFRRYLAVARYKTDGTLDPSFGNGGEMTTDFGGAAIAKAVAIDAQGRIIAAGYETASESEIGDFAVARYLPDGTPDPSFGSGGKVTTHMSWSAYAFSVVIDSHNRIVAGGLAQRRRHSDRFGLARYKPDGSLDTSFGIGGRVRTTMGHSDGARAVAMDSHGRIVAVGDDYFAFALARYEPDGNLDNSFSGDGRLMAGFHGAVAASLAIDANDRIVAAGTSKGELGMVRGDFALARYFGDGPTVTISGPSKVRTTHRRARATFALHADEQASFECRIGPQAFRSCVSPYTTRRLRIGKHRLKVRATDQDGSAGTRSKRFEIVKGPR